MEIKFKVNRTVRKSNKLINYRDKLGLTALQQKLFLFSVTELKKKEDFERLLSFDMKDFFGKKRLTTRDYEAVRNAAAQLVRTSISIKTDNGKWAELSLYSKIEGEQGSSVIHFKFNNELRPYLVNLRGNFTSYLYDNVVHFKSGYSVRIYELLVRHLGWQHVYEVSVDYLKELLGITHVKTYKTFPKFREKVLDKASDEINAFSDLTISYDTVKKGRSIRSIRFYILSKEKVDQELEDIQNDDKQDVKVIRADKKDGEQDTQSQSPVDDFKARAARLVTRLKTYGFSHKQAIDVVKVTEATMESGIWKILYDLKLAIADKKIKNPKSYLIKVFKEEYGLDFTVNYEIEDN
ncbi:replication initiation protein [Chondrinema litorale]|uniref:replication initiation protein n=1 Tax=Chondrinema litorale TaxID=2994555 RepID=UPI0025429EC4|nr:replication initiation protein [Chondrinema litorale]UZR96563.1 replication initiation protein [Chondrinema litorale]